MTESDTSRHLSPLARNKEIALENLLRGETVTEAAAAAGVARQTVSAWSNHDHVFQAEFNRRRIELNAQAAELVRNTDVACVRLLHAEIDSGNTEVALQWMKIRRLNTGYLHGPLPHEPAVEGAGVGEPEAPASQSDWLDELLSN